MQKKKKFSIGKLIFLIILAAVVVFAVLTIIRLRKYASYTTGELVSVEQEDLKNTVTFSGLVESSEFSNVVALEKAKILTITVKEGDKVKKGDILATLDTTDIENQILQQKATVKSKDVNSSYSVSDAEKQYENMLAQVNDGSYSEIHTAKLNLEKAQDTLEKAEKKYTEETGKAGTALDSTMTQAKQAVSTAKNSVNTAEHTLTSAKLSLEKSDNDLKTSENSVKTAKNTLDSNKAELEYCKEDLEKARKDRENEDYSGIRSYATAVETARRNLNDRFTASTRKNVKDAQTAYEKAYNKYVFLSIVRNTDNARLSSEFIELYEEYGEEEITDKMVREAKEDLDKKKATLDSATVTLDHSDRDLQIAYDNAVVAYADAKAEVDVKNDNAVKTAIRAVSRAEVNVRSSQITYDNAKVNYDSAKVSHKNTEDSYKSAEEALLAAKKNYEYALLGVDTVNNNNALNADSLATSVVDARIAVQQAQEAYDIAVRNANTQLANLKAAADKQKVLATADADSIQLDILMKKLENCVITAPCDGTITKKNAQVGGISEGVLFIIEDVDSLRLRSTVKEFVVAELKEGDPVTIKLPSMDGEFDGKVSKIALAGVKGSDGKSDGSANFEITADILDTAGKDVRIGMTGKGTVITSSAENVLSVTYDCLVEDDNGAHVCIAERVQEKGVDTPLFTVKFVPVEKGFESDAKIQVISDQLTADSKVLSNATDYTEGQQILIADDPLNPNAVMAAAQAN